MNKVLLIIIIINNINNNNNNNNNDNNNGLLAPSLLCNSTFTSNVTMIKYNKMNTILYSIYHNDQL